MNTFASTSSQRTLKSALWCVAMPKHSTVRSNISNQFSYDNAPEGYSKGLCVGVKES